MCRLPVVPLLVVMLLLLLLVFVPVLCTIGHASASWRVLVWSAPPCAGWRALACVHRVCLPPLSSCTQAVALCDSPVGLGSVSEGSRSGGIRQGRTNSLAGAPTGMCYAGQAACLAGPNMFANVPV
jgi:hypothetical protein